MITKIAAVVAAILALAAMAVALTHAGPVGPRGLQGAPGNAGRAAQTARLGICWSDTIFTQTWTDGSSSTWVSSVSLDQPVLSDGVYTCPQGDTFVSTVPQNPAGR